MIKIYVNFLHMKYVLNIVTFTPKLSDKKVKSSAVH